MIYAVLVVVGLITWAVVRAVPASNRLMRIGVALTVVGLLTTLVMWWMVIPEVVLVAGLLTLGAAWLRRETDTEERVA